MDSNVLKAINDLAKRVRALEARLDKEINSKHDSSSAKIDYVAMMTDVDLDEGKEVKDHE